MWSFWNFWSNFWKHCSYATKFRCKQKDDFRKHVKLTYFFGDSQFNFWFGIRKKTAEVNIFRSFKLNIYFSVKIFQFLILMQFCYKEIVKASLLKDSVVEEQWIRLYTPRCALALSNLDSKCFFLLKFNLV